MRRVHGVLGSLLLVAVGVLGCKGEGGQGQGAFKPSLPTVGPAVGPANEPELEEEPASGPSNSPVSLTTSDGSGLQIVAFEARAVVQDPLAFTELHITFRNPQARQVEGQFQITLPPSATLSRFAMKQAWGWQEGEVVELQAARAAYEDFLHRRQDPALLEKQPGNQFHARVFPIAASSEKEIILSYSEALTRAGEPYRVFLRGLPLIERLDVQAVVGRREAKGAASSMGGTRFVMETVEVHKQRIQPDADFVVPLPAISQQPQAGLRHEELVLARITPVAFAAPDPIDAKSRLLVLFDTSASRALGYEAQVARLGEILGALAQNGAGAGLKLVAFDQEVAEIYEGKLGGFDEEARKKLLTRRPLGASDLGAALAYAAQQSGYSRVLLFSDGIATAGDTEAAALRTRVLGLAKAGVERLDAVVSGGLRDADRLAALVTAGLPRDGIVVDAVKRPPAIARRLGNATVSHLKVSVPNAAWVWPTELNGVQPGDQALVYAALPAKEVLVVNLDGPAAAGGQASHFSYPVQLTSVERPLLERASVSAQIKKLEEERSHVEPTKADELHRRIVDLSVRFRVLCDETALLVLETEEDYARFQIDRRALADILTVGAHGLEVTSRRGAKGLPPSNDVLRDVPSDRADRDGEEDKRSLREKSKDDEAAPARHRGDEGMMGRAERGPGAQAGKGGADPSKLMPEPAGGFERKESRLAAPSPDDPAAVAPPPSSAPAAVLRPRPRPDSPQQAEALSLVGEGRGGGGSGSGSGSLSQRRSSSEADEFLTRAKVDPYEGKLKEVMTLIAARKLDAAAARAQAWRNEDAGDVLALVALGEVAEARGDRKSAARAYGSLIDLFPGRADLRRFAGERLERLGSEGLALAVDTYRKARDQRPDHPASHRLLAYAQLRAGDAAAAFETILGGQKRSYPGGRFLGVDRILTEDTGIIAAAWVARAPNERKKIEARVAEAGTTIPTERSLRFVLNWETDANDVDFHILDGKGGHAFFSQKQLASGGELYADVTTGYGPECFTIVGKPQAYPYRLQAHYYSRGPMGYGMGKLEIIEHDGQGGLRFEQRAFVIMTDQAFVDLGVVKGPLAAAPMK